MPLVILFAATNGACKGSIGPIGDPIQSLLEDWRDIVPRTRAPRLFTSFLS